MTTQFSKIWSRLRSSRKYRNQFTSAQAGRAFAFQLRAIMKKRGITQEELAEQSNLTQGVISRAADPNYGKLTTTIKVKIANGLDMAYLGVLVPFSEATKWISNLSEESVQIKTFEEEDCVGDLGSVNAEITRQSIKKISSASDMASVVVDNDMEKFGSNLENRQPEAA